jgi:hypothetical protein
VPDCAETIQIGIDKANEGDTVMVEPGIYYEHTIDFSGKAITVKSTNPEDYDVVSSTIVDADSLGSVFCFQSNESANSILTGFTITGGWSEFWGGGILCSHSSPTITKNIIKANKAGWGGGGIRCSNSSPTITYNVIRENTADYGGGIDCHYGANPLISHNLIAENHSGDGGGIYGYDYSSPVIIDNTIVRNRAKYGAGLHFRYSCSPILTNNTVTENSANYHGGGIRLMFSCSAKITSTIFWNNEAEIGQEIYLGDSHYVSEFDIRYSDVAGGLASVFAESSSILTWGPGMIDTDPYFTSADSGDYYLLTDSPCIDAGDPGSRVPPNGGDRIDIGACEYRYPIDSPLILTFIDPQTVCGLGEKVILDYSIQNLLDEYVVFDGWIEVGGPKVLLLGSIIGETIPPGTSGTGSIDLCIPDDAFQGIYAVKGRVGIINEEIWDGEVFETEIVKRIELIPDLLKKNFLRGYSPGLPDPGSNQ